MSRCRLELSQEQLATLLHALDEAAQYNSEIIADSESDSALAEDVAEWRVLVDEYDALGRVIRELSGHN